MFSVGDKMWERVLNGQAGYTCKNQERRKCDDLCKGTGKEDIIKNAQVDLELESQLLAWTV